MTVIHFVDHCHPKRFPFESIYMNKFTCPSRSKKISISATALLQIFKNASTVPVLIDIIKCVATFLVEEMDLAVNFLEKLTKTWIRYGMKYSTTRQLQSHRHGSLISCVQSTALSDENKSKFYLPSTSTVVFLFRSKPLL